MVRSGDKLNVAVLGTSVPRQCGLAVFAQDLMDELALLEDFNVPRVIAVNDHKRYAYGHQVMAQIDQDERLDYTKAPEEVNRSAIDLVVIQHEFGIYGGDSGEYVLDFAETLQIPVITTFHTVLEQPTAQQRRIVTRLADLSAKVVTMAQNTAGNLAAVYGVDSSKIEVLHHGVPYVQTESRPKLKERFGYANRQILSTFGFLSPGKGIEYGIEAMSGVVARHPEALYIVWGKTHPVVREETGEAYRQKLTSLVSKLGLDNHVKFVDKLLTQEEVIQSLVLSDIYMTPYVAQEQAVSGTLAYGIGYGRAIVSTPYRYAEEMLAGGRGLLAKFRDVASLEACILELLEHPLQKRQMETRAAALGHTMMWSEIAKRYALLFRGVMESSYTHLPSSA